LFTNENHTGHGQRRADLQTTNDRNGLISVELYVVSDSKKEGWTYVGPPVLKSGGYIATKPDYTITNVVAVDKEEVEIRTDGFTNREPCITIQLPAEKSDSFKHFTEKEWLNTVVFALNGEPSRSAVLWGPIENGKFSISFKSQKECDHMFSKLKTIMRKDN